MSQIASGHRDFAAALALMCRAQQLDPLSPVIQNQLEALERAAADLGG